MDLLAVIPWDDEAELVIFDDGAICLDTDPIPFDLVQCP